MYKQYISVQTMSAKIQKNKIDAASHAHAYRNDDVNTYR